MLMTKHAFYWHLTLPRMRFFPFGPYIQTPSEGECHIILRHLKGLVLRNIVVEYEQHLFRNRNGMVNNKVLRRILKVMFI